MPILFCSSHLVGLLTVQSGPKTARSEQETGPNRGLDRGPDRTTSNFQKYIFLLIFTIIIFKTHCKSYLLNFKFNIQIHKYNLRSQITSKNQ